MAKIKQSDSEFVDLGLTLGREVKVSQGAILGTDIEEAILDDPAPEEIEHNNENVVQEEIKSDEIPRAMPFSHLAATVVNSLDGLQATLIPMWRKSTLFTSKDLEILDGLDTTGRTLYPANSPEQKILIRWHKFLKYQDMMPFTEGEKSRLIEAGERYCATMQIQVSPFTGLLFAVSEVLITRATYTFSDI